VWSLLHWLYPTVFPENSSTYFSDSFDLTKGNYNTEAIEASRRLLDVIMIRRTKSEIDLSIPPKIERFIYLPLSPLQRFWYMRLLTHVDKKALDAILDTSSVESAKITDDEVSAPSDFIGN
jgi:SWI/SNF-related matrix-associated actin-dependent regulator of chromatin subfamily A member 5